MLGTMPQLQTFNLSQSTTESIDVKVKELYRSYKSGLSPRGWAGRRRQCPRPRTRVAAFPGILRGVLWPPLACTVTLKQTCKLCLVEWIVQYREKCLLFVESAYM